MHFLRGILPPEATMLVDISNMKDDQLTSLEARGHTLFLLSTQKTFNFRAGKGKLPSFLKEGTVWAVLTIPFSEKGTDRGLVSKFSPRLQRFEHRKLPKRSTSSPSLPRKEPRLLPQQHQPFPLREASPLRLRYGRPRPRHPSLRDWTPFGHKRPCPEEDGQEAHPFV